MDLFGNPSVEWGKEPKVYPLRSFGAPVEMTISSLGVGSGEGADCGSGAGDFLGRENVPSLRNSLHVPYPTRHCRAGLQAVPSLRDCFLCRIYPGLYRLRRNPEAAREMNILGPKALSFCETV